MGTSGNMSTSNQYVKYTISINQNSQNVSNNYSNVTVTVRFFRTNSGYTTYGSGTCYCKINGTTYSSTVSPSQKITNSGIVLFNKTLDIYHNNDGTKNLTCSAWIDMNTPLTSSEQSYSQNLSTIPRASKPTLSASSITMGNSLTIYTNRASSSFTHSLYYQIGSGGWNTISTGIGTSKSWTVPIGFANNTPNSTNLSVKLWLETYNGSTYIGCNSVSFTANVPSNIVPTINAINLSEVNSEIYQQFGAFVQGKSKISGNILASGSYSSTIKSYSVSINGSSYTTNNFTTDYLISSGENVCSIVVKDSRGRAASKTINFNVIEYANPVINAFSVSRCNQDGSPNDEGNCVKCVISANISGVNNKNTKLFQIKYKKVAETEWNIVKLDSSLYNLETIKIIQNIDTESEYNFKVVATDFFSFAEYSHNVSTAYTVMDFLENGKGIALGKVATDSDLLDINFPTKIRQNVDIDGNLTINNKTIFDLIYPVGSIYMSVNETDPSLLFGGTWTAWSQGRVPVGVNTSDSNFNLSEKTGGSSDRRHEWRIGMHWWYGAACGEGAGSGTGAYVYSESRYDGWGRNLDSKSMSVNNGAYNNKGASTGTPGGKYSQGDTSSKSNLQPYITCYMWKRVA